MIKMNEKIKLLELAVEKVSSNKSYLAFLINRYLESESISRQEMRALLHCTEEDYYKLGLCKTPDIESADFLSKLNGICEYTHTSTIELNQIIKRANAIVKFSEDQLGSGNYLMAARDKHNIDKKKK